MEAWWNKLGFVKINSDTACDANKKISGIGVVIRNEHNVVQVALIGKHPNVSLLQVEILAVREGIRLAVIRMGFRNVLFEFDSLEAIELINGEDVWQNEIGTGFLTSHLNFFFAFCRESNGVSLLLGYFALLTFPSYPL